ncbi:MAG: FlgD immunoglobulin-like domain containing protein [Candidatus Eisenbacteria bacterium]|nr:FlgD immunoglobulin-like domain containing protein [Candidatus Eisenbacteria bacterium]
MHRVRTSLFPISLLRAAFLLDAFLILLAAAAASAPAGAQDLVRRQSAGREDAPLPLYVVPADSALVLTSVLWHSMTTAPPRTRPQIVLRSQNRSVFYVHPDYDPRNPSVTLLPYEGIGSEIEFAAGSTVELLSSAPGMRTWKVEWSGYLVPRKGEGPSAPAQPAKGAVAMGIRGIGPNPSHGVSRVLYRIPSAGDVALRVFDAAGRAVRTMDGRAAAAGTGTIEWDGRNDEGHPAGAGIYFLELLLDGRVLDRGRTIRMR